jgi:regulator of protease activity HflC (stomatin/prohibitin superfamily)
MSSQILFLVAIVLVILFKGIFKVKQWERAVVLRFGKLLDTRGPGLRFIIPFIDEEIRIDLRVLTFDIPPQDVITRDNISVKVNGVVLFQVFDPVKACHGSGKCHFGSQSTCPNNFKKCLR